MRSVSASSDVNTPPPAAAGRRICRACGGAGTVRANGQDPRKLSRARCADCRGTGVVKQ